MGADEYQSLIHTIRLDLLEIFGSGYVIDHCISAFSLKQDQLRREQEEKVYRNYIADCLKVITENTAKSAMGEAYYITNRLADIIDPNPAAEEEKTGDEIAEEIMKKAGLSFGGG